MRVEGLLILDDPMTRSPDSISILMTEKILTLLFVFINSIVVATGYAGITLLMAIESACIPLPSELIMPFAGYLVYTGAMKLVWAATAGAIGCNLGSLVAYEIGCYGGRPLVVRYGRWILMGHRELDWADRFFLRWGDMAVFIARLLPVIRTFIALPAGIARMPRGKFHIYTFLGSWPWCFVLAYFGMKLGENWRATRQVLPQVRRDHRSLAVGRDRLVPLVALAESPASSRVEFVERRASRPSRAQLGSVAGDLAVTFSIFHKCVISR